MPVFTKKKLRSFVSGDVVLEVGEVITPLERLGARTISIKEENIKDISKPKNSTVEPDFDFSSCMAIPGFVDIHMHGYGGYSSSSTNFKEFKKMSEILPKHGVTSFFPSTMSQSKESLIEVAKAFKEAKRAEFSGSRMVGLHLEGPHLGKGEEKGVQYEGSLRPTDLSELEELVGASGDNIERLTLAPELEGALDYIEKAVSMGILVSAGHTDATYEEAIRSFDKGVKLVNHLYNGMRKFHHREPGILGAALTRDDIYAELIADLVHLHPAAIKLAIEAKGVERLVLITDSISAAGLSDGEYELGEQKIVVDDGVSRIEGGERLAGSTLTLDVAVRNLVNELGLELKDAVRMATLNPAELFDLYDRGKIREGCKGDIVIINESFEVVATILGGEVYS